MVNKNGNEKYNKLFLVTLRRSVRSPRVGMQQGCTPFKRRVASDL